MNEKKELRTSYVGRATEDTQRLLREVVVENEKLQVRFDFVERENERLRRELASMILELQQQRHDHDALRQQLSEVESESRSFATQFAEIEERNMNLANLYVSSYQLHGTLDRGAVLESIKEILINLIGCEELAVFELSEDAADLELVTSFGIDEEQYRSISIRDHVLGKLVSTGGTYIGGMTASPGESLSVTACLPLTLDGRVTGAIVLFSLLPHKPGLRELDFELFDLLGTHAATALYCTSLHGRVTAGVVA
jgi:regulator of replication initiation timing